MGLFKLGRHWHISRLVGANGAISFYHVGTELAFRLIFFSSVEDYSLACWAVLKRVIYRLVGCRVIS